MRNACLTLLVALLACRDSAYSAASKVDTIDGWRQFIEQNPKDDNLDAATERLTELEFTEATRAHSVIAYKRFIEAHPEAPQTRKAITALETLRFTAAQQQNSTVGWRQFLREHSEGPHAEEAAQALAMLELQELKNSNDPKALAHAVATHGELVAGEAAAKLESLAFAEANSTAALLTYLEQYPAGLHRDEARVRLLSREFESLVFALDVKGARALLAKSPLGARVSGAADALKAAEAWASLSTSTDALVRRALPSFDVRPFDELLKAVEAPDALDRADAVSELGQHLSPRSIDPLLMQIRSSRSALVRQRAFDALAHVIQSLPHDVAEFEVATRLKKISAEASDAQVVLTQAVLLDLTGQLDLATREYQRSFEPQNPDPLVLRRWSSIRQERGQLFSAAVTARQLVVWADQVVKQSATPGPANVTSVMRELCFALESEHLAEGIITLASTAKTEFPDDVVLFKRQTTQALALATAKVRDAELVLLEQNPKARTCADTTLVDRLTAGETGRTEAVKTLANSKARDARATLAFSLTHDPSPKVRAVVKTLLNAR